MPSEAKILANRMNALLSTGPRTEDGKASAALNRLTHGLRSKLVTIPGEDPEAWERHRNGIVESFLPANEMETQLAERIALGFWRLQRCATLEALMTEASSEAAVLGDNFSQAEEAELEAAVRNARGELKEAKSDRENLKDASPLSALALIANDASIDGPTAEEMFLEILSQVKIDTVAAFGSFLRSVGVPESAVKNLRSWDGWTGKLVRQGIQNLLASKHIEVYSYLGKLLRLLEQRQAEADRLVQEATSRLERAENAIRIPRFQRLLKAMAPTGAFHDKLMRYESQHLRQLLSTQQALERLQARRNAVDPETKER